MNILDYSFSIEYKRLSEICLLRNIQAEIDNGHFPFYYSNILTKKQNMDDKKTTRHVGVMSLDYKSCLSFILSVISRVNVLSVG